MQKTRLKNCLSAFRIDKDFTKLCETLSKRTMHTTVIVAMETINLIILWEHCPTIIVCRLHICTTHFTAFCMALTALTTHLTRPLRVRFYPKLFQIHVRSFKQQAHITSNKMHCNSQTLNIHILSF